MFNSCDDDDCKRPAIPTEIVVAVVAGLASVLTAVAGSWAMSKFEKKEPPKEEKK